MSACHLHPTKHGIHNPRDAQHYGLTVEPSVCHRYGYEIVPVLYSHCCSLLLINDLDGLRDLLTHSLLGAVLKDETTRTGAAGIYSGPFGWKTEDGYCHVNIDSFLLAVRGMAAMLEEESTAASHAALHSWLPTPAELLRIAEYEVGWLCFCVGTTHPALLCARLHGERLGNWNATVEVAEGLLRIEEFNPVFRTEALRLLGRAKAKLGERAAACKATEDAVAEAVGAKYVWLEMLSLHDLLQWSQPGAVEGVRARLRAVVSRMSASSEELTGILGEGVL